MAILKTVREAPFGPDTSDTEYFSYVAQEISSGFIDDGLWTRALAETQYDERKARARYITLRVSVIMREVASESAAHARLAEFRRSLDLAYQLKDYETCLAGWRETCDRGRISGDVLACIHVREGAGRLQEHIPCILLGDLRRHERKSGGRSAKKLSSYLR